MNNKYGSSGKRCGGSVSVGAIIGFAVASPWLRRGLNIEKNVFDSPR